MSFDNLISEAQAVFDKAVSIELGDRVRAENQRRYDNEQPLMRPYVKDVSPSEEAQMKKEVEADLGDVVGLFQPFAGCPDPTSFDGPINDWQKAISTLSAEGDAKNPVTGDLVTGNTALGMIDGVRSDVDDWTGRAAKNFQNGYLREFPTVVSNQRALAAVLHSALGAEREIWKSARKDIDQIVHDTDKALDAVHSCGADDWKIGLAILGAVCTLGGIPLAGVAVAATTLKVVGAAASLAGAGVAVAPKGDEPKMGGGSAPQVISNMKTAVEKLRQAIFDSEKAIADTMSSNLTAVNAAQGSAVNSTTDDSGDRSAFTIPRPDLANANAGDVTSGSMFGTDT